MRTLLLAGVAASTLLASGVRAGAQRARARVLPPAVLSQTARPQAGQGGAGGQRLTDSVGRARLEGEIRRGFAQAVRRRIGLTDEQITRLAPMTQRYELQRRQLQRDERDARLALREQMRREDTADAARVDQLLRTLVDVQKRRVALLESEQRDLATVMTPLQRAKFMALQEQIRRRLEQMRQRRAALVEGDVAPSPTPQRRPPR